jgi:hypothetical protein
MSSTNNQSALGAPNPQNIIDWNTIDWRRIFLNHFKDYTFYNAIRNGKEIVCYKYISSSGLLWGQPMPDYGVVDFNKFIANWKSVSENTFKKYTITSTIPKIDLINKIKWRHYYEYKEGEGHTEQECFQFCLETMFEGE